MSREIVDKLVTIICNWMPYDKTSQRVNGLARIIYNNRKEIGLFTLDDIEIDSEKAIYVMLNALAKFCNENDKQAILARTSPRMAGKNHQLTSFLVNAIAKEKPIKVKDVKTIKKHWG